MTSYEAGYKAALFDRALNIAIAAFHSNYTDVQIPGSVGAVVGGVQTFVGITTNAGRARIDGIEFEGNLVARDVARDGDAVRLAVSTGYIDAKYKRFIDSRGIDVADRRRFQNTPKWTVSETLSYNTPVGAGSLDLSTTLSYRSGSQQFEIRTPVLDQPRYLLWDANLVFTSANDRWTFGIHGRNLTNKKYIVSGYNFLRQNPDTGNFILANGQPGINPTLGREGILTAYYGNPRQIFATVGLKF